VDGQRGRRVRLRRGATTVRLLVGVGVAAVLSACGALDPWLPSAGSEESPPVGTQGSTDPAEQPSSPASEATDADRDPIDAVSAEDEPFDAGFVASLEGTIVFASKRGGDQGPRGEGDGTRDNLFMLRPADGEVSLLVHGQELMWMPNVSPDGTRLVFARQYSDPMRWQSPADTGFTSMGIFTVTLGDAPETLAAQAVDLTDNAFFNSDPRWSPDGTQIVFTSEATGNVEIYRMRADGSDLVRLTDTGRLASWPSWSPSGEQVAFVGLVDRGGDEGDREVFVMDADGSNLRQVTDRPGRDTSAPSWSPDGSRLAVVFDDGDDIWQIGVVDLATGELTPLTSGPDPHRWPAWSPDGEALVFTGIRDGYQNLYVMRADGTGRSLLAAADADDFFPMWTPHRLDGG